VKKGPAVLPIKDNEAQGAYEKARQKKAAGIDRKGPIILTLPFFDDFSYADKYLIDPNYKGPNFDDFWIEHYAYPNNQMDINPPSIGVVTFDGLDQYGNPYNPNVGTLADGPADTLTSHIISFGRSGVSPSDTTIYFSFYYQPQGLGDAPQPQDTLILEFKCYHAFDTSVSWVEVWDTSGFSIDSFPEYFQLVMLPIRGDSFLTDSFQFRFRNYANLTGNLDHWNVDYVYINSLAKPRYATDSTVGISDVALSYIPRSIFHSYFSMTAKQFFASTNSSPSDSAEFSYYNNTIYQANTSFKFVDSENYPTPFLFDSCKRFNINAATYKVNDSNDVYQSYRTYLNTVLPDDTGLIGIKSTYFIKPPIQYDEKTQNDTSELYQVLSNYLAYDDGSAEGGFGLLNTPGKIAVRFYLPTNDILQGIYIHFNHGVMDPNFNSFNLYVWTSIGINTNSDVVAREMEELTQYASYLNGFTYYKLDTPVALTGGQYFYVGWEQNTDEFFMNVGFDRNYTRISGFYPDSNIFYNIGEGWQQNLDPTIEGAPMIRPVLYPVPITAINEYKTPQPTYSIHPNPAQNNVYIEPSIPYNEYDLTLYRLDGSVMLQETGLKGNTNLQRNALPAGLYMIRITDVKTGQYSVQKVVFE
jgi:hypothetical protein